MSDLNGMFEKLSDSDKETFKSYFEDAYNMHNALYKNVLLDSQINFGGMEDSFNELITWFDTLDDIFYLIATTEDQAELNRLVPLAIAVYEKINTMYEDVRTSDNVAAINALFTKLYTKSGTDYTLDKRFFGARNTLISILIASGVSDADGNSMMSWDAYASASASVKEFILKALSLLLAQHEDRLYMGDVYELIAAFRELGAKDQATFYLLGVNVLYYEAIEANVYAKLTEVNKVDGLINKILNLEIASIMYENASSAEALEALKGLAKEVEEMVNALDDVENRDTYLAPLYAEYLEAVSKM